MDSKMRNQFKTRFRLKSIERVGSLQINQSIERKIRDIVPSNLESLISFQIRQCDKTEVQN